MFIIGLGTATPTNRYTQKECWDVFARSPYSKRLSSRSRAIVKKVLNGNNGIESRHLALDDLNQAFDLSLAASREFGGASGQLSRYRSAARRSHSRDSSGRPSIRSESPAAQAAFPSCVSWR